MSSTTMFLQPTRASVCLPSGHALSLTDAAGVELQSLNGRLWLTMEGDSRDVALVPGTAYRIDRDGLTLVNAIEASVLRVSIPHSRPAAWSEWVKRVWSWLADVGAGRARARMARGQYHF